MSNEKDGGRRVMRPCEFYQNHRSGIISRHNDFHFKSVLCVCLPPCSEATPEEAAAFKQKIAEDAAHASKEGA